MASITEVLKLCRLCLMKDEVNTPIFEDVNDISQVFLKISTCLPLKVSRDDNLPKNICDNCSYKLELFYEFLHTCTASEKQLITWLNRLGVENLPVPKVINTLPSSHISNVGSVILKQEVPEFMDSHSVDDITPDDLHISSEAQDYVLQQQQQLPYEAVELEFQQENFMDTQPTTNVRQTATVSSKALKRKRPTAGLKVIPSSLDSEDDEDDIGLTGSKLTKTEEDNSDNDADDTAFVDLPSTSGENDQPGPSGVGKVAADASFSFLYSEDFEMNVKQVIPTMIPNTKWNCRKCKLQFHTSTQLRSHRKTHKKVEDDMQYNYKYDTVQQLYTCYTCDSELSTKEEMEKHVMIHEKLFTCTICNTSFTKPYEYACHIYNHDKTKNFQCPLCKYQTNRRTAMGFHIKTFHLRKYIYTCQECGKGFNDCVTFREHNNIHKGIKPFKCIVCSRDYAFSSYLTQHQIRYHTVLIEGIVGPNQCPFCSKRFSRKNSLQKHMVQHDKTKKDIVREKKHLCDICGKGFACVEKMRIHYRVHTGIKPYVCSYCSKSFTKRDYLIMHERVHSGEKPYICKHCGKAFSQGAPLRLHLRIHTGERPYTCHLCSNGFISRGVLNIHLRKCPGVSD